ncbi:MAG: hypothetical protein EPN93_03080 [Spirochaetes bacterium]|nr:MAG: hypothetical protein EPN93_03080 [Spirochaetota bacterium]
MNPLRLTALTAALLMSALFALLPVQCTCDKIGGPETVNNGRLPDNNKTAPPEFEQEGFIGDGVYRVIIIQPAETAPKGSVLEDTARQRALSSLQKYLIAQDRIVDANVTAELNALIARHGTLAEQPSTRDTRRLYYFDVRKDRLKEYLNTTTRKR